MIGRAINVKKLLIFILYNPNLTMEFIEAHPEYNWDWRKFHIIQSYNEIY